LWRPTAQLVLTAMFNKGFMDHMPFPMQTSRERTLDLIFSLSTMDTLLTRLTLEWEGTPLPFALALRPRNKYDNNYIMSSKFSNIIIRQSKSIKILLLTNLVDNLRQPQQIPRILYETYTLKFHHAMQEKYHKHVTKTHISFTCESTLLTFRAYSNTSNMSSWNLSNRLYLPCNRNKQSQEETFTAGRKTNTIKHSFQFIKHFNIK